LLQRLITQVKTPLSSQQNTTCDVLIIGAGAAGLMCAALTAAAGQSVMVLDHANKPGKKILMSGGGRCNFTNYDVTPDCYLSHNPHFCKSALSRYTQWDFLALVDRYGIPWHEKKDGQLFCDNKSSDILEMLLNECDQAGVVLNMKTTVQSVKRLDQGGYQLITEQGGYRASRLVVATGGPSIPTLGATGFGYQLAQQFGLNVYEPVAALVPFVLTGKLKELSSALSGNACRVTVSTAEQSFTDDMLFTHRGLSGPAMLQISSYWQPGQTLQIDLLPGLESATALRQAQHESPKQLLKTWLGNQLTQKISEQWLAAVGIKADASLASLNGQQMDAIAEQLHNWSVKPAGTEGYRTAEVALGGVDTDELSSKTLECKQVPGLYFIGEVVDVTGHLGGFNFQWAWSSAWAAAQHLLAQKNT